MRNKSIQNGENLKWVHGFFDQLILQYCVLAPVHTSLCRGGASQKG